jgi:uncharacterized protein (DUF4415 family)
LSLPKTQLVLGKLFEKPVKNLVVLFHLLKQAGPGYQTRANAILRQAMLQESGA